MMKVVRHDVMEEVIYFAEDRWRIVGYNKLGGTAYITIEHRCHADLDNTGIVTGRFIPISYHPDSRGRKCQWCKEHAPEGLQAVFWFLKENELK